MGLWLSKLGRRGRWPAWPAGLSILCVSLLLCSPAWAQRSSSGTAAGGSVRSAAEPAPAAADAVARLPRSAELVIVVENASALRHSALWNVLPPAVQEMDGFAQSWNALAQQLDWDPQEAFDRLIGQRLIITMRGLPVDPGPDPGPDEQPADFSAIRWAVLSEVSADTEARLLARLQAAPRNIVHKHQILSVEGGAYELAIHRPGAHGQGRNPTRRGDRNVILLGPARQSGLFDETLLGLAGGDSLSIRGTPAHAAAGRLGRADILLLHREPGPGADARDAWSDFAAMAIRQETRGRWSARLLVDDRSMRPSLLRIPVTSDVAFKAMSAGALAAILETRLPPDAADGPGGPVAGNPVSWILDRLGVPPQVQEQLGDRQALLLRAVPTPPGLALAIAAETRDVVALARAGDEFVADAVALIERELGSRQALPAPPPLAGLEPGTVRVLPVDVSRGSLAPFLGAATPVIAWAYTPSAPSSGPAIPAATAGLPGWWTLALALCPKDDPSAASDLVKSLSESLAAAESSGDPGPAAGRRPEQPVISRRWMWQGFLHPARIEAATAPTLADFADWRSFFRPIRTIRWEAWVTDEGALEGTIQLDLAPASARE